MSEGTEIPVIVLVRPQLGENIGKAARAMLNFGLAEIRLVEPRDGWPNPAAGPAEGLGHPSRGSTRRISASPKLSIARAALPMFSPSWGRTRTRTGGGAISFMRRRFRARHWRSFRNRAPR